ncbi:NYN domain-containing protein [Methanoculleus sp.]|jgi:uncharacterized LabA/DUF88 family protein|uniref:NYN domain-containing protein n=1 Tax=Methanoculleus sp. TaxID=90427 RepID=UPI001BD47377|nr:NYN domain-containing protein [Methanoculleus sp.]
MEYILKPFESQKRLAVLIDADNTSPAIIKDLLDEIAKYGTASVKRIYGNWTSNQLQGWKEVLLKYSIQPIQQFSYTTGKNATDSAMIIDAMDLLYTHKFNGFCLVSSDSDFTRLAARIREAGLTVFGFGRDTTPKPFVDACDKFIYTEIIRRDETAGQKDETRDSIALVPKNPKTDKEFLELLISSVEDASDEQGWAHLSLVTQTIQKKSSAFDPRNYGFKKVLDLVAATGLFDIDPRSSPNSDAKSIYIKKKEQ